MNMDRDGLSRPLQYFDFNASAHI